MALHWRFVSRVGLPIGIIGILCMSLFVRLHNHSHGQVPDNAAFRTEVKKLTEEIAEQHELNLVLQESNRVTNLEVQARTLEIQVNRLQEEHTQLEQAVKMAAVPGASQAAAAGGFAAAIALPVQQWKYKNVPSVAAAKPAPSSTATADTGPKNRCRKAQAANTAPKPASSAAEKPKETEPPTEDKPCVPEMDTDYFGSDIGDYHVKTYAECCTTCKQTRNCQAWTFVKSDDGAVDGGVCWMKNGQLRKNTKVGIVSGMNPMYKPSATLAAGVMPTNHHRNNIIGNTSAYHEGLLHLLSVASMTSKEPGQGLQHLRQELTRWNLFGPVLNAELCDQPKTFKYVVTVLCSNRAAYLQLVLDALERTAYAEDILVVVSHDGIYYDTMAVAASMKSLRVKQVFFPMSRHISPYEFPGDLKTDCPGGWSKRVPPVGCTGDKDHYGHYRESRVCAIKHHWWWLQNFVWDVWSHTRQFGGFILFLEEDHVVADDFVETLNGLTGLLKQSPDSNIRSVSLDDGQGAKKATMRFDSSTASVAKYGHGWGGNMGYAWERALWKDMKVSAADVFCTVDDSNWDFSIEQVFKKMPPFQRVHPVSKRIQHVGSCGMHIKGRDCDPKIKPFPVFGKESDRPWSLDGTTSSRPRHKAANNGGWGDRRDHALCQKMMHMEKYSTEDVSATLPRVDI